MMVEYKEKEEWIPVSHVAHGGVAHFDCDWVHDCPGLYIVADPEGTLAIGEGNSMIVRIYDGVVKVIPNTVTCRLHGDAYLVIPRS